MKSPENTKPFDAAEIRKCFLCGRGVMHDNNIVFYEVAVQPICADLPAIRQLHGLEMMMGGAAPIARALAPSTTIAHRVGTPNRVLCCMECLGTNTTVAVLLEANSAEEELSDA